MRSVSRRLLFTSKDISSTEEEDFDGFKRDESGKVCKRFRFKKYGGRGLWSGKKWKLDERQPLSCRKSSYLFVFKMNVIRRSPFPTGRRKTSSWTKRINLNGFENQSRAEKDVNDVGSKQYDRRGLWSGKMWKLDERRSWSGSKNSRTFVLKNGVRVVIQARRHLLPTSEDIS